MTFSVTKEWGSGNTLTYTDLNQNFTDIESILNGGLKSSNLSSGANITATQIQDRYHMVKTVIPLIPFSAIPVPGGAAAADNLAAQIAVFSSSQRFDMPTSATTLFKHQIICNDGQEGFLTAIHAYVVDIHPSTTNNPILKVLLNGNVIGQQIELDTDDAHYKLHSNDPFTNPLVSLANNDVISVTIEAEGGTSDVECRGLTLTLFEKWRIAS